MSSDPVNSGTRAAGAIVLLLVALAAPAAHGQSSRAAPKGAAIDELKRAYLSCDRAAMNGRLQSAAVMQCSIIYEELKRRAFGGNFESLLVWSRTHPSGRDARR